MIRPAQAHPAQSQAPPRTDSVLPVSRSGISVEDWNTLFSAVTTRLRSIAAGAPAGAPDTQAHGAGPPVHTSVLECVAALDQLHEELAFERADGQAEGSRTRRLAPHDDLTALRNGKFLRERMDRLLARAGPRHLALALLYLDLDGFTQINETHGHAVGDEVLRIVAARLSRLVRAGDTVGHLGGDEFACLLATLPSLEQLSHLACKLFDAVSTPLQIDGLALSVRASIGIATFPLHGVTAAALLRSADAAMYRAKRNQIGYAFFEDDNQSSFFGLDGDRPEGRPGPRQPAPHHLTGLS